MSYLVGGTASVLPNVDERIADFVVVVANCEIPEMIRSEFEIVSKAVADQMEKEGMLNREHLGLTCLFLPSDSFTIRLFENENAVYMRLAVYPIFKLLNYSKKETRMLMLAEELCHLIWEIRDEVKINDKVEEVMKNYNPDMTKQRLGYWV